jgi:hypothetical protein
MDIVGQTRVFVTTKILPTIKKQHVTLFIFGIKALSLTAYDSLGSNARQIVENTCTASSKMYRLVSNKTMVNNFHLLVKILGITRESFINVDFSTFCGFQTLAFAKQTGQGRALPVWNDCLTYPIEKEGSQNIFVLEQIQKFGKTLGFFPRFVFDRGFWIPCVMKFFLRRKILFYLRIKKGQHLAWAQSKQSKKGKKAYIIGNHTKDAVITVFGYRMRLIVSPPPPKQINPKKPQNTQPWYIVTNDMDSSREEVLHIYATRFEIEETFKDYKHIQRLKRLRIKTCETFTILLWFASLAFWLAFWVGEERVAKKVNPKKKRSFFRIFWEDIQREFREETLSRLVTIQSYG